MTSAVDRLVPVPIRDVWQDEARDLTPWLAENLDALSEALESILTSMGLKFASGHSAPIWCCAMPTPRSGSSWRT